MSFLYHNMHACAYSIDVHINIGSTYFNIHITTVTFEIEIDENHRDVTELGPFRNLPLLFSSCLLQHIICKLGK